MGRKSIVFFVIVPLMFIISIFIYAYYEKRLQWENEYRTIVAEAKDSLSRLKN